MELKNLVSEQRVAEILAIICENVSHDWRALARALGIPRSTCDIIAAGHVTAQAQCQAAVALWGKTTPSALQPRGLRDSLRRCRYRRLVDIFDMLMTSSQSVDHVLSYYVHREERVRHAMYCIADDLSVCKQWRLLAKKLGLDGGDIAAIDSHAPGRCREKTLQTLFRWRLLVPLAEFTVAALVRALISTGAANTAHEIGKIAEMKILLNPAIKKRKGEVLIHMELEFQDLSRLTKTHSKQSNSFLPSHSQKEYVMNKILIRLLDDLEDQTYDTVHPLVDYFDSLNGSAVSRVSRRGQFIAILCNCKKDQQEIWQLVKNGDISRVFSQLLMTDEIRQDLGIDAVQLRAYVNDWELMTSRSQVSIGTPTPRR